MPQLDKNRPSTPLERQIFQALVDVAVELELKSIEPELVSEAVEDGLREAGLAVSNRLLETMDEAVGIRPGTTRQALRRLTVRGQITRIVEAGRGRYLVGDRLFHRFIELRLAER